MTPPRIIVAVVDGVVQGVANVPDGIEVEIREYVTDADGPRLKTDAEGCEYPPVVWPAEQAAAWFNG